MADIDIGKLSEAINNKADRDIENLTTDGYVKGSGLGMPSSKYVDLTLGSSGTTYTAPANGWVVAQLVGITSSTNAELYISTSQNFGIKSNTGANGWARAYLPVKKGDTYVVRYQDGGTLNIHRLFYAEGSSV